MKFIGNHIEVDPPKNPKKITGTRFGAILGRNPWMTPFQAWCEITRTYQKPFEDNIYTIAGKTIEPKQAEYMKEYYFMDNLLTPTAKYGAEYFKTMKGDFFPDNEIFGGMWDYVDNGTDVTVLEMKTTKRAEDWVDNEPEYYALQVALYGYLLGADDVCLVCSVLDDKDYGNADKYVPSPENTFVRPFEISSRYPDIEELIEECENWYHKYVLTGISPDYDEKLDKEYLDALRTKTISPDEDTSNLIAEADILMARLDEVEASVKNEQKRLKLIQDELKKRMLKSFTADTDTVSVSGENTEWYIKRTAKEKLDEDRLKNDGIYNTYLKKDFSYTLRHKEIKK